MIALIYGIEWTNWTNKQNRDRLIDGEQMTAKGVVRGGGIEQRGKRTHGHGHSVVIMGGGGIRGPNDNGKNTINIKFFKSQLYLYIMNDF